MTVNATPEGGDRVLGQGLNDRQEMLRRLVRHLLFETRAVREVEVKAAAEHLSRKPQSLRERWKHLAWRQGEKKG